MNAPLRTTSKQTQRLVKKSLRAAISSTTKTEAKGLGSLVSWNGNAQTAVGTSTSARNKMTTTTTTTQATATPSLEGEELPMKLAHYIQKRQKQQETTSTISSTSTTVSKTSTSSLQEKWAKLASLTMDPSISNVAETIANRQPLPQTLTEAMSDPRPCMIASLEDPFTIVNVNQAWCFTYHYTKDEVLNQNCLKLLGSSPALEDFILEQLFLVSTCPQSSSSSHEDKNNDSFTHPILHYARDGTPMEESLRVGSLSIGADVSDRYMVCVTEMEANHSKDNTMITSLDDATWGSPFAVV